MVSKIMLIGAGGALMGILALIFMMVYISSQATILVATLKSQNVSVLGPLNGNASLSSYGIFSYNNSEKVAESATMKYNFPNATLGYAILRTYSTNPIRRVYLVNTGFSCFKCFSYSSIYYNLYQFMSIYGLILNSSSLTLVNLSSIGSLPPGSILIIPSGLMPSSLIPDFNTGQNSSQTNILTLLSNGDTIIYVGDNFSRSIENGITYFNPQSTIQQLSLANLTTTYPKAQSVGANSFFFNSSTFSFSSGKTYGSASYKNYTTGTLITFSNYPQKGWLNANMMSLDLTDALRLRFWMNLTEESNISEFSGPSGSVNLFTTNLMLNDSPDITTIINNSYSLVTASFFNRTAFIDRQMPFRLKFIRNGTLSMPAKIGENQTVPLSLSINSSAIPIGSSINSQLFHIDIYNASHGYVYSLRVGFFNTSLNVVTYTSFIFKPGNYTAYLKDSNNRIYGAALFQIPPLYINSNVINLANGTLRFTVINNNVTGTKMPYNISINHEYTQSGVITNGTLTYILPHESVIPYGNETINLTIFGIGNNFVYYYSKPFVAGIPSLYVEFGIAAFFIIVLNLLVKDPNRDEFFIDVPSFPPIEKTVIKIPEEEVLSIFNSTNERFGWHHMPLTADEVKTGINYGIKYNDMPITVTSANSSELLYKLYTEGKIENILSYFMPKKWEEESGHDIKYLAIFRNIHDFAVKNALLFTDIDKAGDCDMLINNKGIQRRVYFYSEKSGTRKIKILKSAPAFLVFITSEERLSFIDRLYNTYGKEAERLRNAIESSELILVDTENLKPLLY